MPDKIIVEIYTILQKRYNTMAKFSQSEHRINEMLACIVENCLEWPTDKTGRWLGYIQCLLIEVEKITTIEKERDFTRPLFHNLYAAQGLSIPASRTIK